MKQPHNKRKRNMLTVDLFREIQHSFERFLSIFAIVALGVAFFAGIRATSSIMKASADRYFDESNLMDYYIMCNFGLVEDDVRAIREIPGVAGVYATNTTTVVTSKDASEYVMIVHGIDINHIDETDPDYINRYELIEGRWPEKSGECLIEDGKIYISNLAIGDTITLDSGTTDDILDTLATKEYTIVGVVRTAFYLSYEKGSTNIRDGEIDSFLIIPNEDFIADYYSVIYVTVDGAQAYDSYQDDYFDYIGEVGDRLSSLGVLQAEKRYADIIDEATEKLNEAKAEYEDGVQTYNKEIEDAERKLEDGRMEIVKGQIELSNQKLLLQITLNSYATEIETYKEMIKTAQQSYDTAKQAYDTYKVTAEATKSGYEAQLLLVDAEIAALDQQIAPLEAQIATNDAEIERLSQEDPTANQAEITRLTAENASLNAQLLPLQTQRTSKQNDRQQLQNNIDTIDLTLSMAEQELNTLKTTIDTYNQRITDGEKQMQEAENTAGVEFAKAEKKLADAQKELTDGQIALEKAKIEGQAKLDDGAEEITKAEKDIEAIAEGEWYVLDRNYHYSYRDYGGAADRMDRIASVFPVFFFLVSALVCSTTMTRMIDEQRSSIGTLKALGYSSAAIVGKYLRYSFFASICGCVIGIVSGMYIFPTVIFEVWNTMYTVRHIVYVPKILLIIITSIIAIIITALASFSSCYMILKDVPASLLRPKAPVIGKKILLERISFLWKRFSFTAKVTSRNIFRYKKRFFMTVIGIAGCSALLLAGFGIRDSIGQIVTYQFEEIISFDASAVLDDALSTPEKDAFLSELKQDSRVEDAIIVSSTTGTLYVGNEELSVSIYVPEDLEKFKEFYTLRIRTTREVMHLKATGVILSEKAAKDLGLSVNDKVTIGNEDGYKEQATVIGISENYVGHYAYMSPSYYKTLFDIRPVYNTALIKLNDTSDATQNDFGSYLIDSGDVTSITFYSGLAATFMDMIGSIDLVVIVMIISAGLLAFVVLYNLSNVNISERMREIATLKVLGFTDKETSSYVYREIAILTLVGSLVGLVLGRFLHRFIMSIAELDNVMFGREIYPISYVLSVVITLIFSIIVHLVMSRKLKQIKMIESLKSVE